MFFYDPRDFHRLGGKIHGIRGEAISRSYPGTESPVAAWRDAFEIPECSAAPQVL